MGFNVLFYIVFTKLGHFVGESVMQRRIWFWEYRTKQ